MSIDIDRMIAEAARSEMQSRANNPQKAKADAGKPQLTLVPNREGLPITITLL